MPRWLKALGSVALLLAVSLPCVARSYQTSAAGLDGKRCRVYLYAGKGANNLPLVLSQQGTGIYTMSREEAIEPALRRLVAAKRIAVLTIDKPGIGADPARPAWPVVNDHEYERYTQSDLVACHLDALDWALKEAPASLGGAVYLSGHSEGAQVLTRLYRYFLLRRPDLAQRVRMLLLSGLPMSNWRHILDGQLNKEQKRRFWGAFTMRDTAQLRPFGGLTFPYLAQVIRQEPLRATLKSLWSLDAKAPLRIFQGLADRNTRAADVMDFERLNTARALAKQSALDLRVRYYEAGHALNSEALHDIDRELEHDLRRHEGDRQHKNAGTATSSPLVPSE